MRQYGIILSYGDYVCEVADDTLDFEVITLDNQQYTFELPDFYEIGDIISFELTEDDKKFIPINIKLEKKIRLQDELKKFNLERFENHVKAAKDEEMYELCDYSYKERITALCNDFGISEVDETKAIIGKYFRLTQGITDDEKLLEMVEKEQQL